MILSKKSFYITVILVAIIDQISKYTALYNLNDVVNLSCFMNFVLVKNFGISFGILNFGIPYFRDTRIPSFLSIA